MSFSRVEDKRKELTVKGLKSVQPSRCLRILRLGVTVGLATLFLAALVWGLRGVTPVCADPGGLHVDGAGNVTVTSNKGLYFEPSRREVYLPLVLRDA
jgi:hypothetical protein